MSGGLQLERLQDQLLRLRLVQSVDRLPSLLANQLLRYFGDTELSAITTIRVVDFMADMKERSYSPSYINDAVRVLKMLLRQAVERNVVAEYPVARRHAHRAGYRAIVGHPRGDLPLRFRFSFSSNRRSTVKLEVDTSELEPSLVRARLRSSSLGRQQRLYFSRFACAWCTARGVACR